jgi:uncharacterized protein with PIN domain
MVETDIHLDARMMQLLLRDDTFICGMSCQHCGDRVADGEYKMEVLLNGCITLNGTVYLCSGCASSFWAKL